MALSIGEAIIEPGSLILQKDRINGQSRGGEGDSITITWFNGHVIALKSPGEYNPVWRKWDVNQLPIIPPNLDFKYSVRNQRQFDAIVGCLASEPKEIVNACDAGREGELIFREFMEYVSRATTVSAKITRMWIESTVERGLRDAWEHRKKADQAKFNRLAEAGFRRNYADWLFGINLTRYATAALDVGGETIHVGRVQTPVLGMISYREKERADFIPENYYRVDIEFENNRNHFKAKMIAPEEKMFGNTPTFFKRKHEAQFYEREVNAGVAHWEHLDLAEEGNFHPPEPFSLMDLQRTCARMFQWTPKYTLELAQEAYLEDKIITYPRTESPLIPIGMLEHCTKLHGNIWRFWISRFFPSTEGLYPKQLNGIYFREKISGDHHGILPTEKPPRSVDSEGKIRDVYRLWELITKRFILSMLPTAVINNVRRMLFYPDEEEMRAVAIGMTLIDPGWFLVEEAIGNTRGYGLTLDQIKAKELPPLVGKTSRRTAARTGQGITEKLPYYNDDTLLETMKRRKLGTAATRAEIIENLIVNGYTDRDSKGFISMTPLGTHVVRELNRKGGGDLVRTKLAAFWEDQLDKAEKGRSSQSREEFLRGVFSKAEEIGRKLNGQETGDVPVICPGSGREVVETPEGFHFEGYAEMIFPKKFRGRSMTAAEYRDIIVGKRSGAILEFTGKKSNRPYRARVTFRPRKLDLEFKPAFRRD